MEVIVTLVVVLALTLLMISLYSRLIELRKQVKTGWKQLATQLQHRHELATNLVSAAGEAVDAEQAALDAIVAAHNRAMTARGPSDAAAKEQELTVTLNRLLALVETSPRMLAAENLRAVQHQLTANAGKIAVARRVYNDIAAKYNMATRAMPHKMVAALGSFPPAELFEANTA